MDPYGPPMAPMAPMAPTCTVGYYGPYGLHLHWATMLADRTHSLYEPSMDPRSGPRLDPISLARSSHTCPHVRTRAHT